MLGHYLATALGNLSRNRLYAATTILVLAAALAVAIAWLTVSWQSFMVARARPAAALRYE